MMKRAKALEVRRDKAAEEAASLLRHVEERKPPVLCRCVPAGATARSRGPQPLVSSGATFVPGAEPGSGAPGNDWR